MRGTQCGRLHALCDAKVEGRGPDLPEKPPARASHQSSIANVAMQIGAMLSLTFNSLYYMHSICSIVVYGSVSSV